MAGIVFMRTKDLEAITSFYRKRCKMELWLDQGSCIILQSGNQLLGFCQRDEADVQGTITFFYPDRAAVDELYQLVSDVANAAPAYNPDYKIYHFFARDPEGRLLEFQSFEHDLKPYCSARDALMQRRSIRKYQDKAIEQDLLNQVFELCRWSPTARNQQGYYYIVIRDKDILRKIVEQRGTAGNPILAAPIAVAVCASGELSRRVVQDACIAAYHLLLAAYSHGLGTCWVTDMDQPQIKNLLGVPEADYIACLSPLGYPAESFTLPERHSTENFVKYL